MFTLFSLSPSIASLSLSLTFSISGWVCKFQPDGSVSMVGGSIAKTGSSLIYHRFTLIRPAIPSLDESFNIVAASIFKCWDMVTVQPAGDAHFISISVCFKPHFVALTTGFSLAISLPVRSICKHSCCNAIFVSMIDAEKASHRNLDRPTFLRFYRWWIWVQFPLISFRFLNIQNSFHLW